MNRENFGKQLQKYRERAGYSQEKLAEKIECNNFYILYRTWHKISRIR